MRVEQAIYGEVRGGHALRMASGDGWVPAELTSRLDLPDTAPPGVEWSPFLSGFPHGDHYVLARTFLDTAAPRPGMVLSHALIAPLREIVTATNLRPLLALLIVSPSNPTAAHLETMDVVVSENAPPSAPDLAAIADALATPGTGPVARLGHVGFDDLITALWGQLWPQIRRVFSFRLSFGPSDLVETPIPAIVCTPPALAARWVKHRIIDSSSHRATTSLVAAMLSGGEEGWPIRQFAQEIGANLASFADLPLLEQAYRLGDGEAQSFEHTVAALRLVDRLSPDPEAGQEGKRRLLARLSGHLPMAAAKEVLLLRNFGLTGLASSGEPWTALTRWAAENRFSPGEDQEMLSVIVDATASTAAVSEWRGAVLGGLAAAARTRHSGFANALWRWAEAKPPLIKALSGTLPSESDVEERLANAAPLKLTEQAADAVMALAFSRQWFRLHGAAASAGYVPLEAAHRQLAADVDPSSISGLRLALQRATPAQVLACSLELNEPRVARIAAEAVAERPSLLLDVDLATAPAQAVWALALGLKQDVWRGPKDPEAAFAAVLTNLLDGGPADHALIAALSTSPVADLANYPRRTEVWLRVSGTVREKLLAATGAGWLQRAASGSILFSPDPDLEATIIAGHDLDATLFSLVPIRIGAGLQIMAALKGFDEQRFLPWLRTLVTNLPSLTTSDAEAIGRLVLDRRWQNAADELVELTRTGRNDFGPALRVCHSMFGLWTRLLLDLVPLSSAEKWKLLEHVAVDLYPSGPDHNELWSRAGGRDADLQHHGNGQSRWRDAFARIRRGGGLRVEALLREMRHDYPWNDQLRFLAGDYEFGGRR
jgi:hypothetical protein